MAEPWQDPPGPTIGGFYNFDYDLGGVAYAYTSSVNLWQRVTTQQNLAVYSADPNHIDLDHPYGTTTALNNYLSSGWSGVSAYPAAAEAQGWTNGGIDLHYQRVDQLAAPIYSPPSSEWPPGVIGIEHEYPTKLADLGVRVQIINTYGAAPQPHDQWITHAFGSYDLRADVARSVSITEAFLRDYYLLPDVIFGTEPTLDNWVYSSHHHTRYRNGVNDTAGVIWEETRWAEGVAAIQDHGTLEKTVSAYGTASGDYFDVPWPAVGQYGYRSLRIGSVLRGGLASTPLMPLPDWSMSNGSPTSPNSVTRTLPVNNPLSLQFARIYQSPRWRYVYNNDMIAHAYDLTDTVPDVNGHKTRIWPGPTLAYPNFVSLLDYTMEPGETTHIPDYPQPYAPSAMSYDVGTAWFKFDCTNPAEVLEFWQWAGTTHWGITIYKVLTGTPVTAANPGQVVEVQGRGGAGYTRILRSEPGYTYYFQVSWKYLGPGVATISPTAVVFHLHPRVPGDDFAGPLEFPSVAAGSAPLGVIQYSTAEPGEVWSELDYYTYGIPPAGSSWYRWTAPKDGVLLIYFSWSPTGYYGMHMYDVQYYGLDAWDADELLHLPKAVKGHVDADGHMTPRALDTFAHPFYGEYGTELNPVGGYKYAVEKDKTYIFAIIRSSNEGIDYTTPFTPWYPSTAGFANNEVNMYWQMLPFPPDLAGDFGNPNTAFTPAGPTP